MTMTTFHLAIDHLVRALPAVRRVFTADLPFSFSLRVFEVMTVKSRKVWKYMRVENVACAD